MATKTDNTLWMWGDNGFGALGQNQAHAQLGAVSSPVQIPGTTWDMAYANKEHTPMAIKTDGTLWLWGGGGYGVLAQNNTNIHHSSPVQVPGTTWSNGENGTARSSVGSIKNDGTLWRWGRNYWGGLGINESEGGSRSSPIQVPGTWSSVSLTYLGSFGLKTNGELWAWGQNDSGQLGQNNTTKRSSPVQVGSDTNWSVINSSFAGSRAIKEIG